MFFHKSKIQLSSQKAIIFAKKLLMKEIIYTLSENIDAPIFYGTNNANMNVLRNQFPQIQFSARGLSIKIHASEQDAAIFTAVLKKAEHFCLQNSTLEEKQLLEIIKGEQPFSINNEQLILHGVNGKNIVARTENQRNLVKAYEENDLLFAIGPAGSGKTYTAIALAVRSLKNKEVKKIILSRPAVEAGEKLGFLPGDMKEKIDPYLQPLYDALQEMIPAAKLKEHLEKGTIQIAPLAFMRGRTLNDAVIILDEAQNTTIPQMKMFLTRLGINARMIVTGDMTQIDLPLSQKSGLRDALEKLKSIKGIHIVHFAQKDIVRHRLVQKIVEAYEKKD